LQNSCGWRSKSIIRKFQSERRGDGLGNPVFQLMSSRLLGAAKLRNAAHWVKLVNLTDDAEHGATNAKTFELSQSLADKWLTADFSEKRKMVEIVVLNFSLDGVSLVPTINKPFDMLVKGLLGPIKSGR
jgi:hypothetical protein